MAADQGPFEFPVTVKACVCANGETWEFTLMMGMQRVNSVFKDLATGDSISAVAAAAFLQMIAPKEVPSHRHAIIEAGGFTSGPMA